MQFWLTLSNAKVQSVCKLEFTAASAERLIQYCCKACLHPQGRRHQGQEVVCYFDGELIALEVAEVLEVKG